MIKRIFLDTETTSLDRFRAGLWQFGGVIEIGKRLQYFKFECDIFDEDDINEQTMEMHRLTIKSLGRKQDPGDAFNEFQQLLSGYVDKFDKQDKFYFINYGAEFDAEVLRQWFLKNGDEYFGSWFWHPPIDVMVLAMQHLIGKRQELKSFKLASVCDHYGIKVDETKLHDSVYDATLARELYHRICYGF